MHVTRTVRREATRLITQGVHMSARSFVTTAAIALAVVVAYDKYGKKVGI